MHLAWVNKLEVSQICIFINIHLEADFVNPKIVTNVPGPGHVDPNDTYTTKEHSKS